ncbi:MAG TPA: quaternary ammonium compound efflux SMR transporter SugE [Longimicrobium sp.]|nr:quaternary ammonium compound efflux SMR transporter SugE [Longimicrobium sp.]
MAWVFLVIAGLLEVVWAIGLKYTEGFTRLWPSVGTLAAMGASMWLLSMALRTLPVGTGYAVWTGIGIVGASILGMVLFNESRDAVRIVALLMIVGGIVLLRVHEAAQSSPADGEAGGRAAVAEQPAVGGHADVQPGGGHHEARDPAEEHHARAAEERAQDAAPDGAERGSADG